MSEPSTTTIFSTTTMTSTKILTRTILTASSFSAVSTNDLHLNPTSGGHSAESVHGQSLYPYAPSLPLGITFTILYFIATVVHGYLCFYLPTRAETVNKHRYTIPLFVASILSTIGYLTRTISSQPHHSTNLALYTTSSASLILSPIFFCASLYILLTRLVTRCLPSTILATPTTPRGGTRISQPDQQKFLFLPPSFLGIFLITSDALTFLTQAFGAAWAASNSFHEPRLTQGSHVLQAGIALQLSTFLLFLLVLHLFCLRVRNSNVAGFNPCVMKVVIATWIASGFVLLRTVFRLVAFAAGPEGYAFTHEWCLHVFEALPIWIGLVVMGWWHPVKWIQERILADMASSRGRSVLRQGPSGNVVEVVIRKPVGRTGADTAVGAADAVHELNTGREDRQVRRRSKGRFGFGF